MKVDSLTTEFLRKKFKNNFDLCNFSINIAKNLILSEGGSNLAQILQVVSQRADQENALAK